MKTNQNNNTYDLTHNMFTPVSMCFVLFSSLILISPIFITVFMVFSDPVYP